MRLVLVCKKPLVLFSQVWLTGWGNRKGTGQSPKGTFWQCVFLFYSSKIPLSTMEMFLHSFREKAQFRLISRQGSTLPGENLKPGLQRTMLLRQCKGYWFVAHTRKCLKTFLTYFRDLWWNVWDSTLFKKYAVLFTDFILFKWTSSCKPGFMNQWYF